MAAEAVRWNSLQRKEWDLFGKEFFNDCLQNSNLQSCQETVQKWKNKSYGNLSISDRNEWESFVVDQYQPLMNLCGEDAVCQFHISQNMIISMIKYADKPKYAHDWINDEIQALRIAIPIYKGDKSQIALLAAHDFGWMVELGAFGKFSSKTIQFFQPLLPRNKVSQAAFNDLRQGRLPGRADSIGAPREIPKTPNPSQTAEDFAIRFLGRKPNSVDFTRGSAMNRGDCQGYWRAQASDGSWVVYRPAGKAGKDTLPTTATLEVNSEKIRSINGGRQLKLKFPKE